MAKVTICDLCKKVIARHYILLEHKFTDGYSTLRLSDRESYELHLECVAPFGRQWEQHDD